MFSIEFSFELIRLFHGQIGLDFVNVALCSINPIYFACIESFQLFNDDLSENVSKLSDSHWIGVVVFAARIRIWIENRIFIQ